MLHKEKRQSLIQWFNCLTTVNTISSLSELADGKYLCEIAVSVWEEIDEIPASPDLRYDLIKKYVDEFFHLQTDTLINYKECTEGNEFELAKMTIFLLTAIVQHLILTQNTTLNTLTLLETAVQEDIEECLSFIMNCNVQSVRIFSAGINRILTRQAKTRGSLRQSLAAENASQGTPQRSRSLTRGKGDSPPFQIPKTNVEESPLKVLIDSPAMRRQITLRSKEREIMELRKSLHLEENKNIDFRIENRNLKKDIDKRDKEIKGLKYKLEEMRKEEWNGETSSKLPDDNLKDDHKPKNLPDFREMSIDNTWLKEENARLQEKNDEFKTQLETCTVSRNEWLEKFRDMQEKLEEYVLSYKKEVQKTKELENEGKDLRERVSFYKHKFTEVTKKESSEFFSSGETVKHIIEVDDLKQQLSEKEVENLALKDKIDSFFKEKSNITCLYKKIGDLTNTIAILTQEKEEGSKPQKMQLRSGAFIGSNLDESVQSQLQTNKRDTKVTSDSMDVDRSNHIGNGSTEEDYPSPPVLQPQIGESQTTGCLWQPFDQRRSDQVNREVLKSEASTQTYNFVSSKRKASKSPFHNLHKSPRRPQSQKQENDSASNPSSNEPILDADRQLSKLNVYVKKLEVKVEQLTTGMEKLQEDNKKLKVSCQKKHAALQAFTQDVTSLNEKMSKEKAENQKQAETYQINLDEKTRQIKHKYITWLKTMEDKMQLYKADNEDLRGRLEKQQICHVCLRLQIKNEPSLTQDPVLLAVINKKKNEEANTEACKDEEEEGGDDEEGDVFTAAEEEEMKEMQAIMKYMSNPTIEAYRKLTFKYHRQLENNIDKLAIRGAPHKAQMDFPLASMIAASEAGRNPNKRPHSSVSQSFRNGVSYTCADDEESFVGVKKFKDYVFTPPQSATKRIYELQRRNTYCPPHMKTSYPVELQAVPLSQFSHEAVADGISRPSTSKQNNNGLSSPSTSTRNDAEFLRPSISKRYKDGLFHPPLSRWENDGLFHPPARDVDELCSPSTSTQDKIPEATAKEEETVKEEAADVKEEVCTPKRGKAKPVKKYKTPASIKPLIGFRDKNNKLMGRTPTLLRHTFLSATPTSLKRLIIKRERYNARRRKEEVEMDQKEK